MALGTVQTGFGLLRAASGQDHGDGGLGAASGQIDVPSGLLLGDAGGLCDDFLRPAAQLLIGLHHVHHQVLVGLAHTHHGGGGDHIQNQLLGGARLQTGGAGEHLGPHHRLHGHLGGLSDGAARVAGDGGGVTAHLPGVIQRPQHIGGAPAGGNADDQIVFGQAPALQVLTPQLPAVLRALHGLEERVVSPGDEADDHVVADPECGRAFGGVQHAQPPAGARAQVKHPASGLDGGNGPLHHLGDLGKHRPDGLGDLGVLPVHGGNHLQGGHDVQLHGVGVSGLRCHFVQVQAHAVWLLSCAGGAAPGPAWSKRGKTEFTPLPNCALLLFPTW